MKKKKNKPVAKQAAKPAPNQGVHHIANMATDSVDNTAANSPADLWQFTALDTLFFKESRPMEAIGGAQLQSVFPPPARTLIGAIRTAIGQAHEVDWRAYASDRQHPLRAVIGSPDALEPLSFGGPFLMKDNARLFPVPLALLHASMDAKWTLTRLQPSNEIILCDLGAVRLPKKRDTVIGAKPYENAWITAIGLRAFLDGGLPEATAIEDSKTLYDSEERLGIGRDNASRTTSDGLLYQTRHIRPRTGVSVGMAVNGLNSTLVAEQGTTRLGAEGRLASWQRVPFPQLPWAKLKNKNVMLLLLTPARFAGGWLPDGFTKMTTAKQQTVWEGIIHGVALRLIASVVGKPLREGGWDMVHHVPRTMDSLTPAGSCYFCEVIDGDAGTLNGRQIGQDTEFGRGEIAVGNW